MRSKDRFRGCLLAGAAGDALGYEVEFMSEQQIFRRFGAAGITGYCLHNGVAKISDDTQMSLFTAAGLIDGELERACGSTAPLSAYVRSAYKDWYRTQTGQYPLPREYGTRDKNKASSRLLAVPALFSRRAPGTTCLTALGSSKEGTGEAPINNSKGCGCVMRVAPVGLFFCGRDIPIEISDRIAAETAAITHACPHPAQAGGKRKRDAPGRRTRCNGRHKALLSGLALSKRLSGSAVQSGGAVP